MIAIAAAAAVVVIVDVVGANTTGLLGRIGTGRNLACRLRRPETETIGREENTVI